MNEEEFQICYIKVVFPAHMNQNELLIKVKFKGEEARDALFDSIRTQFGEGVEYQYFNQDEGRREAGRMVLLTHPRWEELVKRGLLIPLIGDIEYNN